MSYGESLHIPANVTWSRKTNINISSTRTAMVVIEKYVKTYTTVQ